MSERCKKHNQFHWLHDPRAPRKKENISSKNIPRRLEKITE
jgi:hypothetical protein